MCVSSPPFPVPYLISNLFPANLPLPSMLVVVVLRFGVVLGVVVGGMKERKNSGVSNKYQHDHVIC